MMLYLYIETCVIYIYIYIYIYNTYIMRTMRIAENSFQANWLIKVMKL